MKKLGLIALLAVIMVSCSSDTIFEKRESFPDLKWNRFKELTFNVPVTNVEDGYDIILTLRHITQYPFNNLSVEFLTVSPSGEERVSSHSIPLKNKDGKFIGDVAGDLWDVEFKLREYVVFSEKGTYKMTIGNTMTYLDTPGIMDVGLKVVKSKIEL